MEEDWQTIVFRADASLTLASGHIMRCLTLAQALKKKHPHARVIFVCNKLPIALKEKLTQFKIELVCLPFDIDSKKYHQLDDANASSNQLMTLLSPKKNVSAPLIDLLVVDHYLLDFQWQEQLNKYCKKLLVIDDLADRKHQADFLLDQTLGRQAEDYRTLVPPNCQLLVGKQFMLLRDEFTQLINHAKSKRSTTKIIKNILVNLGGLDRNNITAKIIQALIDYQHKNVQSNLLVSIVMTSYSPHLAKIQSIIENIHWIKLVIDCDDMANKILEADIAIGACGTTAWERCCLGLPTLAIVLADNQKLICENLANKDAVINLGYYENLSTSTISDGLDSLINRPKKYLAMIDNCFKSCDGLGVKNVLYRLTSPEVTLTRATKEDINLTFEWQSIKSIRRYSRHPEPVIYNDHYQWFLSSLTMSTRQIFIICSHDKKLGILRLDKINGDSDNHCYEISILVAPQAQGQKIALKAIHAIPKEYDKCEIYAYVHGKNKASHKLFQQANFNKIANNGYLRQAYTGLFTNE